MRQVKSSGIPISYRITILSFISNSCFHDMQSSLARVWLTFSSVLLLSHVQLFATPWTAACQTSLSISNSRSLLKLMSIESVMPSNHLILCCPLFLPPSVFPASGAFPVSPFFPPGGQSIAVSASASVLPINIQD